MQSLNPKTWRAAAVNRLEPSWCGAHREEEIEGDLRRWSVRGGERRPRVVAAHGTVDGGEAAGDEP